jgi:hypothetical protein
LRALPPFNPARTTSLTDRDPIATQTATDKLGVNKTPDNSAVIIQEKPCDRFLYAPAPSSLVYQIPDGAVFFRAVGVKPVGKLDSKEADFKYLVYVDGNEVFVSKGIKENNGTVAIEAVVPRGARRIELRVDAMGSSDNDHAVWAYPEFLLAP